MSSQEVLEYYLTAELLTEIPTVIHCSDYFSLKLDIVVYLFWILWLAGSSDVSDFKTSNCSGSPLSGHSFKVTTLVMAARLYRNPF